MRKRFVDDIWRAKLQVDIELEAERLRSSSGSNNSEVEGNILGVENAGEELMASLKNLGLFQDMKDMVAEMDADGFVCLPELRWLACGNHLPQLPEKEMRSLFYVEPAGLAARLLWWKPF